MAKNLRAQWSKLAAEAQAINRKTQELLQALKEHEGTEGLMVINFQEPKCRSTILLLRADHCMKRAKMLEEAGRDIGEWVDVPIAGITADAMHWPWAGVAGQPPAPPEIPGPDDAPW